MNALLKKAVAYVKALYKREPARVIGYVASAIVYVAAANGVLLPEVSVTHDLEIVASIVATVEAIRTQVSPAAK